MSRIALMLTCLLSLGTWLHAQEDEAKPKAAPKSQAAKPPSARAKARAKARAVDTSKLVDINSATREQLMKLPSITPAYADQIIAHRPYLTKEHLVINKALPEGIFFTIRKLVIARQPGARSAPKPGKGTK